MGSRLRPELTPGDGKSPVLTNGTAYYTVLASVEAQDGLIHGRLHERGAHCAIGSFFSVNHGVSLPWEFIEEVAAVNDSVPNFTPRKRKLHVARWLRWKLTQVGMPGYRTKTR